MIAPNRKTFARLCASPLLGMGCFFILSHHLQLNHCLRLPPSSWCIPYSSSFCLALSGLALFFLFEELRFSKILGIGLFAYGLKKYAEYFLNMPPLNDSNLWQMRPLAAAGFLLAGCLFFLRTDKNESILKRLIQVFLCVILISLGSLEMCLAFHPIQLNQEFRQLFIHFYVALGFFLLGSSLLYSLFHKPTFHSWKQFKKSDF